jgi:hypothetical protein
MESNSATMLRKLLWVLMSSTAELSSKSRFISCLVVDGELEVVAQDIEATEGVLPARYWLQKHQRTTVSLTVCS